MGKGIQTAGGEQLQRQRQVTGFLLRLLQQLLPQNTQRRDRAAPLIGRINSIHAPVNDALLQRADAAPVQLFKEGQDKLGFVHHGIAAVAVALHHVHSVDMVGTSRRNADDLAAQRLSQRIILPLRVADKNIVLRGQRKKRDQFLCRKGFAAAGDAGNNGGLVQQIGPVAQQQITGNGILPVIDAARLHDLLHPEGHQRRQRFRGEGTQNIQLLQANGQRCIQPIHLLEAERRHLAHSPCCGIHNIIGVGIQLLLAVRRMHQRHHPQHHPLVTDGQVIQKFLHLRSLLLHVIGNRPREIVVGLLLPQEIHNVPLHAQQTALTVPDGLVHRNGHHINGEDHGPVDTGKLRENIVPQIGCVILQKQHPAIAVARAEVVPVKFKAVRADIVLKAVAQLHGQRRVKVEVRLLTVAIKAVQDTQAVHHIQFCAAGAKTGERQRKLRSGTNKIVLCVFVAFACNRYGNIQVPDHPACMRRFFQQHGVVFPAVVVVSVVCIGNHDIVLEITAIEPPGDNAELCGRIAVAEIQKAAVPQQHGLLILLTGQRIVDVGELPCAAVPVRPHKEDSTFPDRADGDHLLHAAGNTELLRIPVKQLFPFFQHFLLHLLFVPCAAINFGANAPKFIVGRFFSCLRCSCIASQYKLVDRKVSRLGTRNSDRSHAAKNFSAVMPWYFTKPIAAKGAAPRMHSQLTVSVPSASRRPK